MNITDLFDEYALSDLDELIYKFNFNLDFILYDRDDEIIYRGTLDSYTGCVFDGEFSECRHSSISYIYFDGDTIKIYINY